MVGWSLATAAAISVLYGLWTDDFTTQKLGPDMSALYNATGRTAWGASLAWVVFACVTGYGGRILSAVSLNIQNVVPKDSVNVKEQGSGYELNDLIYW